MLKMGGAMARLFFCELVAPLFAVLGQRCEVDVSKWRGASFFCELVSPLFAVANGNRTKTHLFGGGLI